MSTSDETNLIPELLHDRHNEASEILPANSPSATFPSASEQQSLLDFLQSLDLSGIDLEREDDSGREIVFAVPNPQGLESC